MVMNRRRAGVDNNVSSSTDSESGLSSMESISSAKSQGSNLSSTPSISVGQYLTCESLAYDCISALKLEGGSASSLAIVRDMLYVGSSSSNGDGVNVCRHPDLIHPAMLKVKVNDKGKGGAVKSIVGWGDLVVTAHQDNKIRVWKAIIRNDDDCVRQLTTLPTLKDYVLNMLSISEIKYMNITRHNKALWIQHADVISALAVGGDGSLYSASWDRTVKVWRSSDLRCIESFRAHDDAINALVASKDGFVYTGSADKTIKVWNRGDKKANHGHVATLDRHKSAVNALALSADGSLLYSGACDRSLIAWQRSKEGRHMTVCGAMRGHKAAVLCIATREDIVCSGSTDKTVRVWRRGKDNIHCCVAILQGHKAPIKSIAICKAKDSWVVYSGDLHNELRAWLVSCSTVESAAVNFNDASCQDDINRVAMC